MTNFQAELRAKELLPRVLNQEERKHYRRTGRIYITGSKGGKYEIRTNSATGNVVVRDPVRSGLTTWKAGVRLCAHPEIWGKNPITGEYERLPLHDDLITQILAIKADEGHFLRTAYLYSYS